GESKHPDLVLDDAALCNSSVGVGGGGIGHAEFGAVLRDYQGEMGNSPRLTMELQFEALIQQRPEHQQELLAGRLGSSFGEDIESRFAVLDPVRASDLVIADQVVGEADALAQRRIAEAHHSATRGPQVDVDVLSEWSGRTGFHRGHVEDKL